jgi:hypothetical protein
MSNHAIHDFSRNSVKSGGEGGGGGRGVKYVFLSLRRQLRCLAEGKNMSFFPCRPLLLSSSFTTSLVLNSVFDLKFDLPPTLDDERSLRLGRDETRSGNGEVLAVLGDLDLGAAAGKRRQRANDVALN